MSWLIRRANWRRKFWLVLLESTVYLHLTPLPNRKLADLRAAQRKYRERSDKGNDKARPEIQKNRAIYDQLNMAGHDKVKTLPEEVIKKQSESYNKFLLLTLRAYGVKPGDTNEEFIDSEDMDQAFDISKVFDEWSSKVGAADKSCLFRELDDTIAQKVLSKGHWNFKSITDEADKGIDEGGLTRMFLDKCWAQMGKLAVLVEGKPIDLFEEEACGINPLRDDMVRDRICNVFDVSEAELEGNDGAIQALNKVQLFYRAVGRIMCHSLATDHILPCNLLPGILRSCKFRIRLPGASCFQYDSLTSTIFLHCHQIFSVTRNRAKRTTVYKSSFLI
jgi:hypothetical protein